jgi:hypothetical protein
MSLSSLQPDEEFTIDQRSENEGGSPKLKPTLKARTKQRFFRL